MKRTILLVVAALGVSAACDFQRKTQIGPTTPSDVSSGNGAGLMGTWSSDTAGVSASNAPSCGSFVWNVTSQTSTSISGAFSAVCLSLFTVTGTATGNIHGSTLAVTVSGNANIPGTSSCPIAITGTGTIDGDSIKTPYSGSTCLGPLSGTVTLRRSWVQPTPPTPPPAPPPTTPQQPAGADQLDMRQATILNSPRDLAGWTVSTTISRLEIRSTGVHVEFSKQSSWPDVTPPGWDGPLQYTLGMCLNINRWYCSAVVQFWRGLQESGGPPTQFAQNWFYDPIRWAPMTGHQPVQGETIGFFVCEGDCRNNLDGSLSPLRERSNVVLVPMPGPGGATFVF